MASGGDNRSNKKALYDEYPKHLPAEETPGATYKKALYDEYLEHLPAEETSGATCSINNIKATCSINNIKERIQPYYDCAGDKPSSKANENSNSGKGVASKVLEADLLPKPAEKIDFLKKIYEPVERSRVHGFDYDVKSLKMLLLDERSQDSDQKEGSQDSLKLIGVVGVLGVGKTTLCRQIFSDEEVKQRFVPRLWIPMSEEPWKRKSKEPESMEKVVERMLEHLGVQEETINDISRDHKLPGLLYALYLHLKGKRFLIVLDDVRDHEDNRANMDKDEDKKQKEKKKEKESCCENLVSCCLKKEYKGNDEEDKNEDKNKDNAENKNKEEEEMQKPSYYEDLASCLKNGHGFPKGYGGAVVMTSRNEEAIKKMVGEQNLHRLLPLSDPESCWKIYKNLDASKEVTKEIKKSEAPDPAADGSKDGKQETENVDKGSGADVPKEVKEELKKRCGGFPLVARMMREIKQRKDPNEPSTTTKDGSREATTASTTSSSNEPSATNKG